MSLIPRDSVFDFDRLFDNFFAPMRAGSGQSLSSSVLAPRVDVREKDGQYEITAELPGVDKDHLQVTCQDGMLTIEATVDQEDKEEQEGRVIRQERRYGKFLRSFQLSDGINEADIKASFNNGVLKLNVPKAEPKVPEQRRIEIA